MLKTESEDRDDLVSLYESAVTHHEALFAEQRSNLRLVAGLHYNKKESKLWKRLREMDNVSKTQRLRLTKNHTQRITKKYVNNLLAFAPGVTVGPKNKDELSDVKAADMHKAVWHDIKKRHKFPKLVRQAAQDFVEIGEVIWKVFYDPNLGKPIGYEQQLDEVGQVVIDEDTGEPVSEVVMSGDIVYERIHGFNLLSDPDARSWEEVRWACYRKMVPITDLEKMFAGDEEALSYVGKSSEGTYKVFDAASSNYVDTDDLTMLMEFYFRPCAEYPQGRYYIATKEGTLFEGELPLGIFPIIYAGFDEASTSARSFSIIKQLRPYQAEINRAASKIAEHQITLGDDKMLLLNGSSMEPGATAHGVKAIKITGQEPKIMGGRNGDQYVGYMSGQISEMYQVAGVAEDDEADSSAQVDPYAMLFKTAKQKKAFKLYISKFEEFLTEVCELSLRLAKAYYDERMLVPVLGKNEYLNIAEFKDTTDLGFQIEIEPQSDDLETRFGKQLALNHVIQYAGAQMQGKDLGKILKASEYLSKEMLFDEDTIDEQNATSDILAMDRGKYVAAHPEENHSYVIKRLTHRMKRRDFDLLPMPVQQNYQRKRAEHEQINTQQIQQAQAATAGFIPSGGMLITCDFYQPDPADPNRPKRVRIPGESIQWLIGKLEAQGSTQQQLEAMGTAEQARIAQLMQANQPRQLPAGQPQQAGGF